MSGNLHLIEQNLNEQAFNHSKMASNCAMKAQGRMSALYKLNRIHLLFVAFFTQIIIATQIRVSACATKQNTAFWQNFLTFTTSPAVFAGYFSSQATPLHADRTLVRIYAQLGISYLKGNAEISRTH